MTSFKSGRLEAKRPRKRPATCSPIERLSGHLAAIISSPAVVHRAARSHELKFSSSRGQICSNYNNNTMTHPEDDLRLRLAGSPPQEEPADIESSTTTFATRLNQLGQLPQLLTPTSSRLSNSQKNRAKSKTMRMRSQIKSICTQRLNASQSCWPLMVFTLLMASLASQTASGGSPAANELRAAHIVQLSPTGSAIDSSERQLQLLRSAKVELTRRGQRLQRDTPLAQDHPPSGSATCGYPGSPAHASVTFNTSHVVAGTAASYTCDNGYELLGPPRRICQASGTWSPVGIPFCVLNVGLGKAAMQSSTAGQGSAQKAVDGSTTPYFQASICTMTDVEHSPWWYVNLLEPYLVQIVRIDFGTACCANRQKATIAVRVGNNRPDLGNNPLCNRYHGFIEEGKPLFLPCTRPAPGAFVSIHLESPSGSSLSICETFIYTDHALSIEQCPSFRDQPLGSTATYNGKCYLFHNNQALNFDGARKYCESRGGTLVDETSPALQGFLSWELYRRHRNDQLMGQYWLGAVRDTRSPQNWKWISGKDVQISFWNSPATMGNCSRFDGSKGWLWSDTDCQANLNFICQYRPLSCGKPERPTNSTLVPRNIDNATVIEYQCAPGNLLMGPRSRTCLPTGFFSEFAPKCKYLDCQLPAMIANGDYKLLNGTTSYQSLVTYFCNEGFQIYGKASLTCDVDERWNGPPPRCEPLLCSAPVPPSNGHVLVTSNITIPGTQATYDCRAGYELVGDRLLTCLHSGSWDNSFPYCREKRNLAPPVPSSTLTAINRANPQLNRTASTNRPQVAQSSGGIQFPSGAAFAPNRIGAPSSTTSSTTTTSTTTASSTTAASTSASPSPASSSTASLNGLAGQFVGQNSAPTQQDVMGPVQDPAQSNRRPAQSNSVSHFAAPQPPTPVLEMPSPSITQQPPASRSRPAQSVSLPVSTPAAPFSAPTQSTQAVNRQQVSAVSTNSRFPFGNTGHVSPSDSTPLATTNSVSHSSSGQQQTSTPQISSSQPSTLPTTPAATTIAGLPSSTHSHGGSGAHHHQSNSVSSGNVLASQFGGPIRAHNSLASTRYSLDGIIAVAIFGGFIFLGAIITILVIIVRRRKSGHSSTIDAQTISTYDSNGEHNGLYRNYQQAWENLRYASPNSQPKSSGNSGLITAHVSGGPSVGVKNFASPAVALVPHHAHLAAHQHLHGHRNLAMDGSSSSSQSSSLGGIQGAEATGGDPLLRRHHHGHHYLAHRIRPTREEIIDDDDDDLGNDDDDAGDQGVLSSDEMHPGAGEGYRDSNELTINADTVVNGATQGAARNRLYSANSMGRSAGNRLSMGNLSVASHAQQHYAVQHRHHVHHHHSHHHLSGGNSSASSGHQRLVPSSTPSASTRSSQASPPSDDHSLDQLAYGNSWHQNAVGQQQQQ